MNKKQGKALLALYAVDVFLESYAERIPKTISSPARGRFDRVLAELTLHIQTQAGAPLRAKGLTKRKESKRGALKRDFMAPIVRMARLEAARYPALGAIKMPRGKPGLIKFLAYASGMAYVADDYADVFIALGMRPTFFEDMNAAIEDVLNTLDLRNEKRGAGKGATKGVESVLKACNDRKGVLDSLITSELHDDKPLLANWKAVKRIEKVPRSRKKRAAADSAPTGAESTAPADLPVREPSRLLTAPPPSPDAAM